jgi:Zn-dependent alcohol dehydrogenase
MRLCYNLRLFRRSTGPFKAAVIADKYQPLIRKNIVLTEPSRGEALGIVLACGVCHSGALVCDGYLPQHQITGYELVGHDMVVGEGASRVARV